MTDRLHGKVALITGSDSGIGQATAVAFAEEGADLVVTYLHDADGASATRQQVEAAGRRAIVVQLDIRDEAQVGAAFDQAIVAFGTVDILMNNAGVDASATTSPTCRPRRSTSRSARTSTDRSSAAADSSRNANSEGAEGRSST